MSNERKYMVLTAVGPDRPGIVQEISQAIHEAGGNLEDSRMAILGGEFAIIVLFSGTPATVSFAVEKASGFEARLGLRVSFHETAKTSASRTLPYHLHVSGVDRPGIVLTVSRVLTARGVNVASFESRVQYAAESGTPMFLLNAEIQLPSEAALAPLRHDLTAACDEESLEFALEAR